MHQLLPDIGVAVLAATLLGLAAHWSRQPIILGYLLAGAAIGPKVGLALVHDQASIEVISEIGLILLLFIIGLEMDLKALMGSGRQLLVAGFGQFPLCALLGVGLFTAMGYGLSGAASDGLYLALMCGLSSTAVVVKLLYDKGELDTLPGRMTLGVLVIQDVYAIFILAFQPNFASPSAAPILKAIAGTIVLLVAGFLLSKYVLRWVFASIAKAPEMVVAVSIAWCAAVAGAAGALGLSKEMGALVAGLSIAAFPYSTHVTAKTLPLRDFFLTLFFVSLGMQITAPSWDMAAPIAAMVFLVISSRFLTVYPLVALSGGGRRTAFITSLNLSQISEFSLVIASLGVFYKHVAESTVAVTIYAMAATAVLSSYAVRFNHELYLAFERVRAGFGRKSAPATTGNSGNGLETNRTQIDPSDHGHAASARPVVILGVHRTARALLDALSERSPHLLARVRVIDFNPETLRDLAARGVPGTFGDLASRDTLEHARLHDAALLVSTIPDALLKGTDNQTLVEICRTLAPRAAVAATADDARHEQVLRAEGAEHVINPHTLAAARLADLVAEHATAAPDGDARSDGNTRNTGNTSNTGSNGDTGGNRAHAEAVARRTNGDRAERGRTAAATAPPHASN